MRRAQRWRRSLAAALLAAAAAASLPLAAQQRLLPAQSEIAFTSRQMGVPVQGRFRQFEAQVEFDPKQPEAARISMRIDLASTAIGTAETEAELAKPGWFDTRRFPQATFTSTSVKAVGPGRLDITGKLTLKAIGRDIVVPVTLQRAGELTLASGSFPIRRLDFRIGDGDWSDTSLVADEVLVRFKLALAGVAGP